MVKKKWNFTTRKNDQNLSKNGTEKGSQKSHPKKLHFHIFLLSFTKIWYFTDQKGLEGRFYCILKWIHASGREGRENESQCWKNIRKTLIFVFFLCELGECVLAILGVQRPQFGVQKVVRNRWKSGIEKRLVRRRLANLYFPNNGPTTARATRGQTSWKGGRGDG